MSALYDQRKSILPSIVYPSEIQNRIANALLEFKSKNYGEAISLFSDILNIDASNPTACYYKAMAIAQLSDIKKCKMETSCIQFAASVEYAFKKIGLNNEFIEFCDSILDVVSLFGEKIFTSYKPIFDKVVEDEERYFRISIASLGFMSSGVQEVDDKSLFENAQKTAEIIKESVVSTLRGMIDLFNTIQEFVGQKELFSNITSESVCKFIRCLEKAPEIKDDKSGNKSQVSKIVKKYNELLVSEKKRLNEKYWSTHQDLLKDLKNRSASYSTKLEVAAKEKSDAETQRKKVLSEISTLKNQIKAIRPQISEALKETLPIESEYDSAVKYLNDLNTRLSKLSFFQFKEKNDVKTQIQDYTSKVGKLKEEAEYLRKNHDEHVREMYNSQKAELQSRLDEANNIYNNLEKLIKSKSSAIEGLTKSLNEVNRQLEADYS